MASMFSAIHESGSDAEWGCKWDEVSFSCCLVLRMTWRRPNMNPRIRGGNVCLCVFGFDEIMEERSSGALLLRSDRSPAVPPTSPL